MLWWYYIIQTFVDYVLKVPVSHVVVPVTGRPPAMQTNLWVGKWITGDQVQFRTLLCVNLWDLVCKVFWGDFLPDYLLCLQPQGKSTNYINGAQGTRGSLLLLGDPRSTGRQAARFRVLQCYPWCLQASRISVRAVSQKMELCISQDDRNAHFLGEGPSWLFIVTAGYPGMNLNYGQGTGALGHCIF